ncbi:MAG: helix-turn-helix domain-containing protein [Pseudomonadota bacterium]
MSNGTKTTGKKRGNLAQAATLREKVQSKENKIIRAAYEIFVARGYAKTTISDVASKAEVAEGTVYLYFNNKHALAVAVLAAFYQRLTAGARHGVASRASTEDRLSFLAEHHLQTIIKERRLMEMLASLDRDIDNYEGSEIYKMNRAYVAVFDRVLRDGVERDDIDGSISQWVLRDMFFGALDYAMRTMLIKKSRRNSIDQVVSDLVRMIVISDREAAMTMDKRLSNAAMRIERAAARMEKIASVTK